MEKNCRISPGRKGQPKKVIYLACEGGSIGSEGDYIKNLCNKYNCTLMAQSIYKGSADPLTLAEAAVEFCKRDSDLDGEVWIIFDNDEQDQTKVKQAFGMVSQYNSQYNNIKGANFARVNIAFNSPSIETFALLCCSAKISEKRATNQSTLKLKDNMPKYHHEKSPQFDFDKMEKGYASAVATAKSWEVSLAGEPEYTSALFAGIYKLTESIKE